MIQKMTSTVSWILSRSRKKVAVLGLLSVAAAAVPAHVAAQDTARQVLPDSLRKRVIQGASLRSAVIPGWGQLYNRKYWKAPLALGTVGAGVYFTSQFAQDNGTYKKALVLRLDGDSQTIDEFAATLTTAQLLSERRQRKQRLNIAVGATIFSYGINILDAYTDASGKFTHSLHPPAKAALYSALLPGAGQLYNKKYWKLPILYAGLGTAIFFVKFNSDSTNLYGDAYTLRTNGETTADRFSAYSDADLIDFRDFYKSQLDFSFIAVGIIYVLSIIDAIVDAHLYDFDISDDLSLSVWPELQTQAGKGLSPGMRWSLRF